MTERIKSVSPGAAISSPQFSKQLILKCDSAIAQLRQTLGMRRPLPDTVLANWLRGCRAARGIDYFPARVFNVKL
jgi:hypothetical protein